MGNCICVIDQTTTCNKTRRRRKSTVFHDDDEGEKLLGETSNVSSGREIKITMTRKEFEDLMRNIDSKSLTTEEILSKLLIDGGDNVGLTSDHDLNHHQRPWRPALQSIPEID